MTATRAVAGTRIAAHGVTVGYGGEPILSGLDTAIPAGEFTVIVGPNACGKSTLLRTMSRLQPPSAGAVLLDGADIHAMNTRALAKRVGLLPQSATAPDAMTVRDLVARGRSPHQGLFRQWSPADARAVAEAMTVTGVDEFADRAVDSLSGGQRQRAWLAMVLAQETETILLDEPTTFLDMPHQLDILELCRTLHVTAGRTVVAVLHDLNQACRYATHLIAMRAGEIVAHGRPEEVITEESVRAIFDLECLIVPDPITGTPMVIPHVPLREGVP